MVGCGAGQQSRRAVMSGGILGIDARVLVDAKRCTIKIAQNQSPPPNRRAGGGFFFHLTSPCIVLVFEDHAETGVERAFTLEQSNVIGLIT